MLEIQGSANNFLELKFLIDIIIKYLKILLIFFIVSAIEYHVIDILKSWSKSA